MKKIIVLLLCIFIFHEITCAQTARTTIEINNIRAMVLNGGDLFWDLNSARFEVPKIIDPNLRHLNTIFAAGLWIGALDANQQLHLAASTYRQSGKAFEPGPVSDSAYVNKQNIYDKIFYVTKSEIDEFITDKNKITTSIQNWPGNGNVAKGEAKKLAPFVDLNKNDIYEPQFGDYPLIPGDVCAFTVFNDKFKGATALNAEVHQFVYEYRDNSVLNNTVFVTYKIFNRSNNNYSGAVVGHWVDYDLGNYSDDAYCTDTARNMMIALNGDNNDEGVMGYGINPPAMACIFLNQKLKRNIKYDSDSGSHGLPITNQHYYNYLNGLYKDNTPIEPYKCYSPANGDIPQDIRLLGATSAFNFPSGYAYCLTVAHVFGRDSSGGPQASVDRLKLNCDTVIFDYHQNWFKEPCSTYPFNLGMNPVIPRNKLMLSPNPVNSVLHVENINTNNNDVDVNMDSYAIYDVLGMRIQDGKNDQNNNINVLNLMPGIYLLSIQNRMLKFIKN